MSNIETERPTKRRRLDVRVAQFLDLEAAVDSEEDSEVESEDEGQALILSSLLFLI